MTPAAALNYVYFLRWVKGSAVLRIWIGDRKLEEVSDLTKLCNLRATSARGLVFGPDDSPPYSEIQRLSSQNGVICNLAVLVARILTFAAAPTEY